MTLYSVKGIVKIKLLFISKIPITSRMPLNFPVLFVSNKHKGEKL